MVLAIAIVGMIFVGLVAVAGFTVLAQRRQRALGMLSCLGAGDRMVRLVMVANGAVVGVVGALAGTVLGLAVWMVYAPQLSTSANHRIAAANVPWWLVGTTVALAIATAILASRRPAGAATRLPVVSALSGRPAPVLRVRRSALPGAALLVVGVVLLLSGGLGGGSSGNFEALGGLVAVAFGLLLCAPLAIAVLGTIGRHAPVAARIALRDLARYRARSGPALAGISFAVFMAMAVCLIATGRYVDPLDYVGPNLPTNQILVQPEPVFPVGVGPNGRHGPLPVPPPALTPGQQQARAGAIATALDTDNFLPIESVDVQLSRVTAAGHHSPFVGTVAVATPQLLAHYGIDPATINARALLVTSRPGLVGIPNLEMVYAVSDESAGPQMLRDPTIQYLPGLPTDTAQPNLLVTEAAVQRLHLEPSDLPGGWLIQTAGPLTAIQIDTARQIAADAGMTIQTASAIPSLAQLNNLVTVAGILLALGVLAMTLGLIRSETSGDLRILAAAGAARRTRRTITAATAGALGLFGAVLGTAAAYLAAVSFFKSELSQRLSTPPTTDLILILVGLPLVAAAGGWLLAGREPRAIGRAPIQ